MILQALARYYDILASDPDCSIARQGYSTANVSFVLLLSRRGELLAILPLFEKAHLGKKEVEVPRRMVVPQQVIRSGGKIAANFLKDNSAYVLGVSEKDADNPSYAVERFQAFRELHEKLLGSSHDSEAQAVITFLRVHEPQNARDHPLIAAKINDLLAGGNLVFMVEGCDRFVHDAPEMRRIWEASQSEADGQTEGQCLVTGEWAPIARLHPNLKGVKGAQPSGATLVGFNDRAYESYNRVKGQGWNAPTSEKAVFAYTTVLNHLLSRQSETPKLSVGDATVVYWAESPSTAYADLYTALFDPDLTASDEFASRRDPQALQRVRDIAEKVKLGAPLDAQNLLEGLDPRTRFYVLGLAPNAARIAVRFFERKAFQSFVEHIMAHYTDLEIVREYPSQSARIPIRVILEETVSKKSSDKTPAPLMAGALLRSILNDLPYPAALYNAIITRIRADVDEPKQRIYKINYTRAAVIKAFLIRKYRHQPHSPFQEVLCMALNENSTHPAYLLGRLFAVLEKAQTEAIGDVNATIKDRYFTTACASPAIVFPVLLRLAQHHISKAEYGYASDRRIQEILNLLNMEENPIPKHLSLDEQGVFVLGYYHQRAAFYQSKKSKETDELVESTL